MDRAVLEQLLGEGLSLAEIGRRVDRHESTVGYWVKKYRLEPANRRKHASKGAIPQDELEALVDVGASIAEIAHAVGRSKATVRHWLRKHGLNTGHPAGRPARAGAHEAREAGLANATLTCPHHGETTHVREPRGYFRCKRCRTEAVTRRRRKVKEILVGEAGGRCQLCGYDRYVGALEFHHLDPATKSFGLSMRGLTPSITAVRTEAQKCVLLCSNCHAEVEGGVASIPA